MLKILRPRHFATPNAKHQNQSRLYAGIIFRFLTQLCLLCAVVTLSSFHSMNIDTDGELTKFPPRHAAFMRPTSTMMMLIMRPGLFSSLRSLAGGMFREAFMGPQWAFVLCIGGSITVSAVSSMHRTAQYTLSDVMGVEVGGMSM